ncbi:MAG: agmatinase [Byssovorax sp.]
MTSWTRIAGHPISPGQVALLGVPWDEGSSFLQGPARAPGRIRAALLSTSSNSSTESGLELGDEPRLRDAGDLVLPRGEAAVDAIDEGAGALLDAGARVLALGGDHAVTYPLIRAHAKRGHRVGILHFDAHPDLYDGYGGNRFSHASPFARIMESDLADRLVQVGIRTMNRHQREQADRFGVEVIDMRSFSPDLTVRFDGPVYVTIDLDALDPAFAPGVSHHEPGGLSVREMLGVIQRMEGKVIGADVVELNPERDPTGMTAMVAAKLVKELCARLLSG